MNTDHEQSRAVFEAGYFPVAWQRDDNKWAWYSDREVQRQWEAWCRALGYAASRECAWVRDEDFWAWESACKSTFCFEGGGPVENGCKYCPGCGGRVKIQEQPQQTNEEQ